MRSLSRTTSKSWLVPWAMLITLASSSTGRAEGHDSGTAASMWRMVIGVDLLLVATSSLAPPWARIGPLAPTAAAAEQRWLAPELDASRHDELPPADAAPGDRLDADLEAMAPPGPGAVDSPVAVTPGVPMPSFAPDGEIVSWNRRLEPTLDLRRWLVAGAGVSVHLGDWW